MAEALAALGAAAAIAQFAESSIKLSARIHDFINTVDEAPSVLRDITTQLPLLAKICESFEVDDTDPECDSLAEVLKGCLEHIKDFSNVTQKLCPVAADSKIKRAWKATTHALHYEKKFTAFHRTLESFKSTLDLYCSHENRMSRRRSSVNAPTVILPPLSPSVVRYTLLRQIEQRFNEFAEAYAGPRVVVLHGMGGQGKTYLALDFAHGAVGGCKFSHIIWLDATSKKSLARSYEDVADRLANSKTAFTDAESRVRFVKEKLGGNPWLLVLDNLDNPAELGPLTELIPSGTGSVIITSRHKDTLRYGKEVSLSEMVESEALELLLRGTRHKLGLPGVRKEALKIVQKLGSLPLGIDQASAYIQSQELPLELFMEHYIQMKEKVLSQKHVDWNYVKRLDGDQKAGVSLGVLTTWEMSFQQINNKNNHREAVEHLLTLAAFLGNVDVRERFFRSYLTHAAHQGPWYQRFAKGQHWDSTAFREAVAELSRLSLVESRSTKHRECCVALHPIIRDWLQLRTTRDRRAQFIDEATFMVSNFIDNTSADGLHAVYRDVLEHQDACCSHDLAEHKHPGRLGFKNLRDPALSFTKFYALHGRCREAVRPMENVTENDRNEWGDDHPTTLVSVRKLADVYAQDGRYPHAQKLLTSALTRVGHASKGLGIETLRLFASLASVHKYQDHLEEAERLYDEALRGLETHFPTSEEDILLCLENLADVKRFLKRIPESAKLYARAKFAHETRGGERSSDSPDMLRILGRMGDLFRSQGHYASAADVYSRVYNGYLLQYGSDHPATDLIRVNLAIACRNQGKFLEAEKYFDHAIASFSRIRGAEHLDTLRAIMNKAKCIDKQGHYGAAEVMYRVVLKGRRAKLGYVHYTFNAADRLTWMLWKQDKRAAAEALAREIMVLAGKMGEHERLLHTRTGALLPYPALEKLYREAQSRNEQKYTPDHVDVLEACECLSEVLIVHGRYQEGHELKERLAKAEAKEQLKQEQEKHAAATAIYSDSLFDLSTSPPPPYQPSSRRDGHDLERARVPASPEKLSLITNAAPLPSFNDLVDTGRDPGSKNQLTLSLNQTKVLMSQQDAALMKRSPRHAFVAMAQSLGLDKPAGILLMLFVAVALGWQCVEFLQRRATPGSMAGLNDRLSD